VISRKSLLIAGVAIAAVHLANAQSQRLSAPKTIEAGSGFSIQTSGSGKSTLYIIGPGQAIKQDVELGRTVQFSAGSLCNAGHYLALLSASSFTEIDALDVVPAGKPANLSFLAKPSRLPVSLHEGITGAVYVFDAYHNLISAPTPVSFELSTPSGAHQQHIVESHDGAASIAMDSTAQQGIDKFVARVGDVSSTRIVGQVPGDPCGLKMSARQLGPQVQLTTDLVRDCSGNPIPDGTIVTFTASYKDQQSTIDEPLKHGVAEVTMQVHPGATLSVASGVVMGNQIGWGK